LLRPVAELFRRCTRLRFGGRKQIAGGLLRTGRRLLYGIIAIRAFHCLLLK
jgi:hypothetical protein